MTTISILELFTALYATLTALAVMISPVSALYGLLAGTYGRAAYAARADGHRTLARCYAASAVFHVLLGIAHHLHI